MNFAEKMKKRTSVFAIDVTKFCRSLKSFPETKVVQYQLIKSATSVAANYRAATRGRSKREWYSKICIVVEEIDESNYWLEFIRDLQLSDHLIDQDKLIQESNELLKVFSKTRASAKEKNYSNKTQEPWIKYYAFSSEEE